VPLLGKITSFKKIKGFRLPRVVGFGPSPDHLPGRGSSPELIHELSDFDQVPGQNGDGFSAMLNDMAQLLLSAELAIGYIDKKRVPVDMTQSVPGFNMGGVIIAVSRINVVMDRHGPVIGDAQAIDQLL